MANCNICGAELSLVPGGQRKDGSSYKSFMGCPNWKTHKTTSLNQKRNSGAPNANGDGLKTVSDQMQAFKDHIDARLDKLADYLVKKLGA